MTSAEPPNPERRTLLLITDRYPFGGGETFVEHEIRILASHFSRVIVAPQVPGGPARRVPENVEVVDLLPSRSKRFWRVAAVFLGLASPIAWREWAARRRYLRPKGAVALLSFAGFSRIFAGRIQAFAQKIGGIDTYYSYWCDRGGLALARLKRRQDSSNPAGRVPRFVARAHRWDLYDESNPVGIVPYQGSIIRALDVVAVISMDGADYLARRWGPQAAVRLHRLGVAAPKRLAENKCSGGWLHVYSCSNVIPVKRVPVLAKGLARAVDLDPSIRIRWTHLGDGPEMDEVRAALRGPDADRIIADFRGRVGNSEVLRILESEHFDIFLNVSADEGIPVAAMEAESRGVPPAATDVGGNAEVVPGEPGWLLRPGADENDIAGFLVGINRDRSGIERARARGLTLWRERFDARRNYERFVNEALLGRDAP